MFQDLLAQLPDLIGTNLINLLSALGILIIGWIVARLIAWGVFRLMKRTNLDNRLANAISTEDEESKSPQLNFERWISNAVFYLLMLFVLIAHFFRLYSLPQYPDHLVHS